MRRYQGVASSEGKLWRMSLSSFQKLIAFRNYLFKLDPDYVVSCWERAVLLALWLVTPKGPPRNALNIG